MDGLLMPGWDDFYWMVVEDGLMPGSVAGMPGSVAGMTSNGWWWQMD